MGCIIHRDIRFSNILITHNLEPVVGGCFPFFVQHGVIVYILKDTFPSLLNVHLSIVFFFASNFLFIKVIVDCLKTIHMKGKGSSIFLFPRDHNLKCVF